MNIIKGFGINSDNIDWRLDVNRLIYDGIKASGAFYLNQELTRCEEKYADEEFDDMFDAFCEGYENPSYMWYGSDGVVADYIDAVAFDGEELFRYADSCFYVDAADAVRAGLSEHDIKERLVECFWQLCGNEPAIGFYDIHFE